jgi:hypothetical protein
MSEFFLSGSRPSARAISTRYFPGSSFGSRYIHCASLTTLYAMWELSFLALITIPSRGLPDWDFIASTRELSGKG